MARRADRERFGYLIAFMSLSLVPVVAALGLLAGVLTTIAGLGGGMLLVVSLGLLERPAVALAATAPALLVGNVHRLWADRASIDRTIGRAVAAGALPGAFLGGWLAVSVPEQVLGWVFLAAVGLALLREIGWLVWKPRTTRLALLAALGGALTATSGAGQLVLTPLLLACGLRGARLVATSALTAAATHVGRIVAYGLGGWLTRETLAASALLAASILTGNVLGRRVRDRIDERMTHRVTWATLLVALVLAMAGLAR
ncbi:MAG: sulfite exporter TauE/SafE family protein [Myxococcota bacterium]|nr:sulfite exporter TauE/SafE family protein [Myxococcota bacterium]MDW8361882.1 sulfite exporter TauE/SafE family protein [Myxococcales bacterium]